MNKMILFYPIYILSFLLFSCGTANENAQVNNDTNNSTPPRETVEVIKVNNITPNNAGPEDTSIDRIGCYNVENLFDTKDDANKDDSQFLPGGRNKWTQDRYEKKIKDIAKVINYMGVPGIMGLVEIENKNVLKDLINDPQLEEGDYKFVHEESPDHRGIDVALLYDSDQYKLIESSVIRINFPRNIVTNYTTRDVLHVVLKRRRSETFHIFINHWPSRRGGEMESQPKRVYVAQQVKKEVDKILEDDKKQHIILMGDFNDEPNNKSVSQTLGAKAPSDNINPTALYSLMNKMQKSGTGSYYYRGDWNALDQIIVSGTLLDGKGRDIQNVEVFNRKWMLFNHKKYGYRPNRTYGGDKYYGGYSDHLPVSAEFVIKSK